MILGSTGMIHAMSTSTPTRSLCGVPIHSDRTTEGDGGQVTCQSCLGLMRDRVARLAEARREMGLEGGRG
jgi:hypothetical protein